MLITIYCSILGLLIGSAINAIVWRLYVGRSWAHGRSMCPDCEHKLAGKDLIPVLSWLWLRGRCRYCQKRIHWQYPLVEAITAVLFTWSAVVLAPVTVAGVVLLGVWLSLLTLLVILAVYDTRWLILPDKILFPAIGVAGGLALVTAAQTGVNTLTSNLPVVVVFVGLIGLVVVLFKRYWVDNEVIFLAGFFLLTALTAWVGSISALPMLTGPLLAAVGGATAFLALALVGTWLSKKEAMGGGDIKLVFLMGLVLGLKGTALALLMAFNAAALVGILLIAFRGKGRRDYVPFGPFLIGATFIAFLYGHPIVEWYLRLNGLS